MQDNSGSSVTISSPQVAQIYHYLNETRSQS